MFVFGIQYNTIYNFRMGRRKRKANETNKKRRRRNKNVNWLRLKNTYIHTMEPVILISCLMVYTIVIFIVQCQKHHSHRLISLCSFFISILFVFLLFLFSSSPSSCCCCFRYTGNLLLFVQYLLQSLCIRVLVYVCVLFVFTFNEHLRISISMRERHLLYRSFCVVPTYMVGCRHSMMVWLKRLTLHLLRKSSIQKHTHTLTHSTKVFL